MLSGLGISARFYPTWKTSFSNLQVTRFATRLDNDATWTLETDVDRDQDIPARAAWRVWDNRCPSSSFPSVRSSGWPHTQPDCTRGQQFHPRGPTGTRLGSDCHQRSAFAGHDYLD